MARRGSFAGPLPLPKKFMGLIILSLPKACSIRGAPIMEPSADESLAAKTPAKIKVPLQAISFMTKVSVLIKVSRELLAASKIAIPI